MSSAVVSRWSRRLVGAGTAFLLAWAIAAAIGAGRRIEVVLALQGFVLHTVFGKAYALVPSYFDRQLRPARAPALQFPLSVGGTAVLAVGGHPAGPAVATTVGALAWVAGVAVFLGTLGWTIRDNITGAETATGDHESARRSIDRIANAFVPVVFLYLAAGSYLLVAAVTRLPTPVGGVARASHLLGAGGAALLVFAVGFRLFPRLLVAHPPRPLAWVVLPAGAAGPALLAAGLYDPALLVLGGVVEGIAIGGFAAAYVWLFYRSDRRRVGFYAVLAACAAGVVAVAVGLWLAAVSRPAAVVRVHYRLTLVGFLGLTIVGAATGFYPPSISRYPGAGDRGALVATGLLAGGLGVQVLGLLVRGRLATLVGSAGELVALAGAALYAYVLGSVFLSR